MSDHGESFTADQAAAANSALRGALGLPAQRFGTEQFVGMISDEIEQLRAAGKTDGDIASILSMNAGINISPDAISRYYAEPSERGRPG